MKGQRVAYFRVPCRDCTSPLCLRAGQQALKGCLADSGRRRSLHLSHGSVQNSTSTLRHRVMYTTTASHRRSRIAMMAAAREQGAVIMQ